MDHGDVHQAISQDGAIHLRPPLATLCDDDHHTTQRHWILIQPASTAGRHWLTRWATMRNGVDEDGCRAGLGKFNTRRPPKAERWPTLRPLPNHSFHGTQRLRHTTANISPQVFSLEHAYLQRNTQNTHSRTTKCSLSPSRLSSKHISYHLFR